MKKVLLLYVPVLHDGYLKIFKKYAGEIDRLYILGKDLAKELAYLEEEIRAISPNTIKTLIESLGLIRWVFILDRDSLKELRGAHIVTARESVMERLVLKYLQTEKVTYDTVFLRWDEGHVATKKPVNYERVSKSPFDKKMIALACQEGAKTSDWWRKVGAVLVRESKIILTAHNTHVPSEHSPYVHGDIRDFIPAGKHSDISSAIHAEKYIIAKAARSGIALEGTSIYVTVFPCPDCAKVIAYSGIKRCYFSSGHVSFDGEEILKQNGVELVLVEK